MSKAQSPDGSPQVAQSPFCHVLAENGLTKKYRPYFFNSNHFARFIYAGSCYCKNQKRFIIQAESLIAITAASNGNEICGAWLWKKHLGGT
jgi:hypothetical protein